MTQFGEDGSGVHLMSPLESEYTMCGDAFERVEEDQVWPTDKRVVTCPRCITVIRECRGVRTESTGLRNASTESAS